MIAPATRKAALLLASRVLVAVAERCYRAATEAERGRRRQRENEAATIAHNAEAALCEFLNAPALLEYLEGEAVINGGALSDRLAWELELHRRSRADAADAINAGDPERARKAARQALRLAKLAAR